MEESKTSTTKYNYKFSVIIGTYNHAKVIGKMAESLKLQTDQDFEILLCDDGSDDNTKEVFEASLHPIYRRRYRYFRQDHKGMRLSRNINQGIKEAQGEYCLFVMGDSFMDNYYLEVLTKFAKPHRILCGVRYQIDGELGVDTDWRLKKGHIPQENVMLPNKPFNMTTGNGLMVPTEALRKFGGWDEDIEGYGGDDLELVARLYYKGYIVYSLVDAKLYHNWHIAQEAVNLDKVVDKAERHAGF